MHYEQLCNQQILFIGVFCRVDLKFETGREPVQYCIYCSERDNSTTTWCCSDLYTS